MIEGSATGSRIAAQGWQVTAVDLAATAVAYARATAETMGPDAAGRVDWVEADLGTWAPQRQEYDLVVCLYVHVAGSVEEFVQRMASGVAALDESPCDPEDAALQ